jgi:ATP-dependent protease HslVU (ClpYQ) ATPase subunit
MKTRILTQTNKTAVFAIISLTTIAATLGTTLVITPTASAEGFNLFQQVRNLFGDNQDSKKGGNSLQAVIGRGDAEIIRRLSTLQQLATLINNATHLSATDKTTLTNEVNAEISSLTTLKTKLDSEKTLTAARSDVRDIVTEYRVYALVAPKIHLIKQADDIQVANDRLTELAAKLQTRIATEKAAGKDVSALTTKLTDMNAQIAAAQNIAGNIESKVIGLQPSDYNSDHKLLAGYNDQLKTAHADDQAAYADAKSIVETLKTL